MVDIGLAGKKTMARHAPIKLLLKSSPFTRFHSVSFCLVGLTSLKVWHKGFQVSLLTDKTWMQDKRTTTQSMHLFASVNPEGEKEENLEVSRRTWSEEESRKKKENETNFNKLSLMDMVIYKVKTHREKKFNEKNRRKNGGVERVDRKHLFVLSLVITSPGQHLYSTKGKC